LKPRARVKAYKLYAGKNKPRRTDLKENEAEASPLEEDDPSASASLCAGAAQQTPTFVGATTENNIDVDYLSTVAEKVAHYLLSVTAANGSHAIGIDTIDDLLDRVKPAYVFLVGSTPDTVRAVTASTDLLVPDSQVQVPVGAHFKILTGVFCWQSGGCQR
jgi:hypothetical protein